MLITAQPSVPLEGPCPGDRAAARLMISTDECLRRISIAVVAATGATVARGGRRLARESFRRTAAFFWTQVWTQTLRCGPV
jgi:hypothetical protein